MRGHLSCPVFLSCSTRNYPASNIFLEAIITYHVQILFLWSLILTLMVPYLPDNVCVAGKRRDIHVNKYVEANVKLSLWLNLQILTSVL